MLFPSPQVIFTLLLLHIGPEGSRLDDFIPYYLTEVEENESLSRPGCLKKESAMNTFQNLPKGNTSIPFVKNLPSYSVEGILLQPVHEMVSSLFANNSHSFIDFCYMSFLGVPGNMSVYDRRLFSHQNIVSINDIPPDILQPIAFEILLTFFIKFLYTKWSRRRSADRCSREKKLACHSSGKCLFRNSISCRINAIARRTLYSVAAKEDNFSHSTLSKPGRIRKEILERFEKNKFLSSGVPERIPDLLMNTLGSSPVFTLLSHGKPKPSRGKLPKCLREKFEVKS